MPTNQRGFTLIEAVIFIVIVSIAVSAITLHFSTNVQHSADPLLRQKAVTILHQYLDQMQTVRWDESTPIGGGTATAAPTIALEEASCDLALLDDFDDFNCFTATDVGDGFTLDIVVTNGTATWGSALVPANKHKKATATVNTPINESLDVTLYRADY
jgi:MSHA pilin protein MshD